MNRRRTRRHVWTPDERAALLDDMRASVDRMREEDGLPPARRIPLPRPPGCYRHPTDARPGDCPDCREIFETELERLVGNPFREDLGEHPTATSRAEGCSCTACTKFPPGFE